jgi:hypothetical protein
MRAYAWVLGDVPDVLPQLFAILYRPIVISLVHRNHEAGVIHSQKLRNIAFVNLQRYHPILGRSEDYNNGIIRL